MVKVGRRESNSKAKVRKGATPEDLSDDLDLPDDTEDTVTILSEMAAQRAVFDAAFSSDSSKNRVTTYAESTLKLLPHFPEKFETKLLVFCLNYCLGIVRADLIPERTTEKRWSRRTFEALSIGWMRWMVDQKDKGVLFYIANMHNDEPKNEDKSFDTLVLNFWASAIELLVLNQPEEAKRFFERANELGTQVGTSINPSICWTYATSFYTWRSTC